MGTRDARKREQGNKLLSRNELKIKLTKISYAGKGIQRGRVTTTVSTTNLAEN